MARITRQEFNDTIRTFIRKEIADNDDYADKDFDYVFEDVLEKYINDPLIEGVDLGMDDYRYSHAEYDYCDAHEEEWKLAGKWGTRK